MRAPAKEVVAEVRVTIDRTIRRSMISTRNTTYTVNELRKAITARHVTYVSMPRYQRSAGNGCLPLAKEAQGQMARLYLIRTYQYNRD